MTDAQAPKGHTPLPWAWFVEDYSMLNLGNADDHLTGHVVSISPCNSCLKRAAEEPHPQWEWGRCTTISEANAALIVERVNKGPAADAIEAAFVELWTWVRNWEPEFLYDDEFPREQMDEAKKLTGEA